MLLKCLPLLLHALRVCGTDTAARMRAGREALAQAAKQASASAPAGAPLGARPGPPLSAMRAMAAARTNAASAVVSAAGATFQNSLQAWMRLLKDCMQPKLQGCFLYSGTRAGASILRVATSREGGPAAVAQIARDVASDSGAIAGSVFPGILASIRTTMTSPQAQTLAPARAACEVLVQLLDAWVPLPPMPTSDESSSGTGGAVSSPSSPKGGKPRYLDLGATSPARDDLGGVHPTATASPTRPALLPAGIAGLQR